MAFAILPAYDCKEEIGELFREYTDMLVAGDPTFQQYLDIQNYDDELAHLEHKYGLPDGRLYIVRDGDTAVGCIGLRKIDGESCELKRLYIRPAWRGRGLSRTLMDLILSEESLQQKTSI